MKILQKYVFKNFVASFILCITLLIVLGIIGDILGFLDDIFKNNIPFLSIISFYFYLAPFAFVNMVPFACLLSVVYIFNSLSKNHEITAVIASGLSLWELLKPVIIGTFMLCLITFLVNDRVVPRSVEKANVIRRSELERSGTGRRETQDITLYGKGGQIIYAKSFSPEEKALYGLIVHRHDKHNNIFEKVNARVAHWQEGAWMAEDVILFKVDNKGDFRGEPEVYKHKALTILEQPKDFVGYQWDPKYMSCRQLRNYLNLFNMESNLIVKRLLVDLNYKFAFPFTALITVLVGVPFSVETGRARTLVGMAKGIMVAMLYLPVMAVSLALGKGGFLSPVIAAWMSNVIFVVIGCYFIRKKS